MYTVNIDAGGTMTDGLVVGRDRVHTFKVDSTPHDLTVAMVALIEQAAVDLGFASRRDFLDRVSVIRWSSTVTTNVLAERRGPKIGLMVEAGAESNLYGAQASPAVGGIVSPVNIVGLRGAQFDSTEVLGAVRRLLEDGVRRICISLRGSFGDPGRERQAKRAIADQYPDHYLGSVPVLLGSDMAQTPDDMTRTHFSLINAYVHPALAASLFKAEDRLKIEDDWRGTLLVGHTNGGMARIGKTKAVDTIESGPVFGTFAAAYFARRYGLEALSCVDVGGTTAKISFARGGAPVEKRGGQLFGIPVKTPLQMLRSLALGGGSIVTVRDGEVQLGPESMGAAPGPACYALGGTRATLTDCLLLLGYVDPAGFLDGRKHLDTDKARAAVDAHVAEPLGISVPQAALQVRDTAARVLSDLIDRAAREAGEQAAGMPMFAYGGNGPLLAAFAADILGLERLYVSFGLGPVFSAFGTAISNVVHLYEHGVVASPSAGTVAAQLPPLTAKLRASAERDLASEGFDAAAARVGLDLEILSPEARVVALPAGGGENPQLDGIDEAVLRLRTEYAVPSYQPACAGRKAGERLEAAGEREVHFGAHAQGVALYEAARFAAGDTLSGPALIGGGSVSCVLLEGWSLRVDEFGNGMMSREA